MVNADSVGRNDIVVGEDDEKVVIGELRKNNKTFKKVEVGEDIGKISSMGQARKGAVRNKELLQDFKLKDNAPQMEEYKIDLEKMQERIKTIMEKDDPDEIIEGDNLIGDLRIRKDGRPALFPKHLWEKVAATQKPLVQIRWRKFPIERLKKIITQINKIQTDPRRPILGSYLLAQSYANLDVYLILTKISQRQSRMQYFQY